MFSRTKVKDILNRNESQKPGCYILLGETGDIKMSKFIKILDDLEKRKDKFQENRIIKKEEREEKEKAEKIKALKTLVPILILLFIGMGIMAILEDEESKEENDEKKAEEAEEKDPVKKEEIKAEELAVKEKQNKEKEEKKQEEKMKMEQEKKDRNKVVLKDKIAEDIIKSLRYGEERITEEEHDEFISVEVFDDSDRSILRIFITDSYEVEGDKFVEVTLDHERDFTVNTMRKTMVKSSESIFQSLKDYDEIETIVVYNKALLQDEYGKEEYKDALNIVLSRDTLQKIDWDNFNTDNFETVAETYILHDAFKQ